MTYPKLRRSTFAAGAIAALTVPALRSARAADLTKIAAGSSFEDDAGVVIYGNASGTFSRLGLDVNVVKMASGSAGAAAVAGGALDVAKGSVIAVVAAHAHGIPAIGVLGGIGTAEELRGAGADALARSPAELASLLG